MEIRRMRSSEDRGAKGEGRGPGADTSRSVGGLGCVVVVVRAIIGRCVIIIVVGRFRRDGLILV